MTTTEDVAAKHKMTSDQARRLLRPLEENGLVRGKQDVGPEGFGPKIWTLTDTRRARVDPQQAPR